MQDTVDSRNKLRHLGESLIQNKDIVTDNHLFELLEAFEEQDLFALHLSRLTGNRSVSGRTERYIDLSLPRLAKHESMKLACQRVTILVDEYRCNPREVQLYAGGSVQITVISGPPQSFEVSGAQENKEIPPIAAGKTHEWNLHTPGKHLISSNIYPGCQAHITVQPAIASACLEQPSPTPTQNMAQVDEPISFPLTKTSRALQTEPLQKVSRFAATEGSQLPPLRRFNPQATCTSTTSTGDMGSSSEESPLYTQTGLRRRASHRPVSAGSDSSGSRPSEGPPSRAVTPDVGRGLDRPEPSIATGLSRRSSSTSQDSSCPSPGPSTGPIFRPVRNLNALQRSMSPVSTHSSDETMPLLDIRMSNRVQQRSSSVFPTSRGALVSPSSVANPDTTHKCPRCRKEFLSTINQRRCLAVHLGHKAGGSKGAKGSSVPDRSQLVEFWNSLVLSEKQALMNLKAEAGSESILRNMEVRLLQRDNYAHTTEQRTMFAAGRTLFEVLIRGKGLESLSGDALATLLSKTSEGTFLYDRALPARDESVVGYNAEAGLSAFINKRLVDALLSHRQQQADKAQRELEELEDAHKVDKAKQADKKKKDKKVKVKPKQKATGKQKVQAAQISRASSASSMSACEKGGGSPLRPVVEDSACLQQQKPPAWFAGGEATTPSKATNQTAADSDGDLTPPPTQARYTPTESKQPNSLTYDNALYRTEGETPSNNWVPASKSTTRSSQLAAPPVRLAAAALAAAGSNRSIGSSQATNSLRGAQRPAHGKQPADSSYHLKPARVQRPEAMPQEAFPALPCRPAAADLAALETAQVDSASKAPVPGISYVSAAMSVTLKQAQERQRQHNQQLATDASFETEGVQCTAPGQPLSVDKVPLPEQASSDGQPLAEELVTCADADVSAVDVAPRELAEVTAIQHGLPPTTTSLGALGSALQAPEAQLTAQLKCSLADSADLEGQDVRVDGEAGVGYEPTTLTLNEGYVNRQALEALQHGTHPLPPYAYLPPPPFGYYYMPCPSVQFGDVNMAEILQQGQQHCLPVEHCPMPHLMHAAYPPHMPQLSTAPSLLEQSNPPAMQEAAAMMLPAEHCIRDSVNSNHSEAQAGAEGGTDEPTDLPCKLPAIESPVGHSGGSSNAGPSDNSAARDAGSAPPSAAELTDQAPAALLVDSDGCACKASDICQEQAHAPFEGSRFDATAAAQELSHRWQAAKVRDLIHPGGHQPQRLQQQQPHHRMTQGASGWGMAQGRSFANKVAWRPVQREQPSQHAKQPVQQMWAPKKHHAGISNAPSKATQADNGRAQRLPHSFASVVGGQAAKLPGNVPAREWSNDGNVEGAQWRIQAGK